MWWPKTPAQTNYKQGLRGSNANPQADACDHTKTLPGKCTCTFMHKDMNKTHTNIYSNGALKALCSLLKQKYPCEPGCWLPDEKLCLAGERAYSIHIYTPRTVFLLYIHSVGVWYVTVPKLLMHMFFPHKVLSNRQFFNSKWAKCWVIKWLFKSSLK